MTLDAAGLREQLQHVSWIGGGSAAGKSTIARRIADQFGLRVAIEVDTTMTADDLAERVMDAFGL